MKEFFQKHSYNMIMVFVNQIAIALFGIGLSVALGRAENRTLQVVASVFAVLFYLFLIYARMWEVGAKDGISAEARKTGRGLWRGFVIGLCGNVVNILLALLMLPGMFAESGTALAGMCGAMQVISLFLQGMYIGILATPLNGLALNAYVWPYFVIILPSVLVAGVAYIIGSYNLHATNILIPKNKDVKNNGRPE